MSTEFNARANAMNHCTPMVQGGFPHSPTILDCSEEWGGGKPTRVHGTPELAMASPGHGTLELIYDVSQTQPEQVAADGGAAERDPPAANTGAEDGMTIGGRAD